MSPVRRRQERADRHVKFITLASVNNSLKTLGYSWNGDGALKVYKQNSPAMHTRTASYTYMQEVWDQATLDQANDFRTTTGKLGAV